MILFNKIMIKWIFLNDFSEKDCYQFNSFVKCVQVLKVVVADTHLKGLQKLQEDYIMINIWESNFLELDLCDHVVLCG